MYQSFLVLNSTVWYFNHNLYWKLDSLKKNFPHTNILYFTTISPNYKQIYFMKFGPLLANHWDLKDLMVFTIISTSLNNQHNLI